MRIIYVFLSCLFSISLFAGPTEESLRQTILLRNQACQYLIHKDYGNFKKIISTSFEYSNVIDTTKNRGEDQFKVLTNKIYIPVSKICSTLRYPLKADTYDTVDYLQLRKDFNDNGSRSPVVVLLNFFKENNKWKLRSIVVSGE